ncbi:MAG: DMT family transporter [Gammaproteobacteria bacterium]|nr:DMT family transporter [Gammaproteobacteria bacterium]
MTITTGFGAVLVMLLWALCFPLITIGLNYSPPMVFATFAATLAGLVLLSAAQYLKRPPIQGASIWGGIVLVGFTLTSIGLFGMYYGGGRVSPGLATVISNTQPLIAAILASFLLGENLSRGQKFGLLAGFLGILLIGIPSLSGSDSQSIGVIFILIGATGIALGNVVLKRLAGRVDTLRAMGWQLIIGAIPLAVISVATENITAVTLTLPFIMSLMALSVFVIAMPFALWFMLLQRTTLSQLNAFTFLTPIFGLIIGAVFFAEQLHAYEIMGIVLGFIGISAVSLQSKKVWKICLN